MTLILIAGSVGRRGESCRPQVSDGRLRQEHFRSRGEAVLRGAVRGEGAAAEVGVGEEVARGGIGELPYLINFTREFSFKVDFSGNHLEITFYSPGKEQDGGGRGEG